MNTLCPVQIREIAVYHPDNVVGNEYCLEHFKKKGIDLRHFLEDILGRDKRYVIAKNSDENTLTMAITASKQVLKQAHITGEDIDMICLGTNSAEYVVPPTALLIHHAIGGNEHAVCYDINVNCLSMSMGFDQLVRYMSTSESVHRVLLVGAEYMTYMTDPKDTNAYGTYGDSACAMILEKTDSTSCLMDTSYMVNSVQAAACRGPACGFSHLLGATKEEIYYTFSTGDPELEKVVENIQHMLEKHGLTKEDIAMFCFSQFAFANIEYMRESLQLTEAQTMYVGDRYGYTGSNSPFVVLYEAVKANKVKRGDYVFIWTIGAAAQHIFMLLRY